MGSNGRFSRKAKNTSSTQGDNMASSSISGCRVLIVAINYAPELVGCAKYTTELAEQISKLGGRVEVVCAPPYYPMWEVPREYTARGRFTEVINEVTVHRVPIYVPNEPTGLKRIFHLFSFGFSAAISVWTSVNRFKPDLVFTVAPTLASTAAALMGGKLAKAKTWLHVQDFEVDAAFDLGLLKNRALRNIALRFERTIFNRFDHVSSISPAMTKLLVSKGIAEHKVSELRNWVDVDAVRVWPTTDTPFRRELGIRREEVVALYSGNMAAKQGIESLSEVARLVHSTGLPIKLVFCGDGPARTALERGCDGNGSVIFLPLQPANRLAELLATADIHLLPQRPEAADLVLPSKLTGMLSSGRPVVAMASPGTGLASEVDGCGLAVEPTAEAMASALIMLAQNFELRATFGRAARDRAEARWNMASIISGFERKFSNLVEAARAR